MATLGDAGMIQILAFVGLLAAGTNVAVASQLVYTPVNPTFGGNPLNGSYLLSVGQSQGFGVAAKNTTPDLSGLDSAISNLSNSIGSSSVGTPIIILGSPTTPSNP
jgi:curli production assembly/transport component CsgF